MYKLYPFLDNLDWLKEQLQKKTIMQLAEELSLATGKDKQSLHGCITFRVNRWFSDEEKKNVKRGRKPNLKKNSEKTEEIS